MEPVNYGREFVIDRCNACHGLWFPEDSYKHLKEEWMSHFMDTGNPKIGKHYNTMKEIPSPVTGKPMKVVTDKKQPHIEYEVDVDGHGAFFDAGEYTDFVEDTISDFFKSFFAKAKKLAR
jgi:hypothetical protein